MRDFERLSRELMQGANADKLQKLAQSEDGKRIVKMVDKASVENALRSGNEAELQNILSQILSTDEGKRLAAMISTLGK